LVAEFTKKTHTTDQNPYFNYFLKQISI